jgi:hypothetical protein
MKRIIRTFDSHEEADAFVLAERLAMTPAERLNLCFRISMQGWRLHNPKKPMGSLRENVKIEVRDRCTPTPE